MSNSYSLSSAAAAVKVFLLLAAVTVFVSGCTPFKAEIPENFAFIEEMGTLTLFSPDGLKTVIKTETNNPRKDTVFWAESLKNSLEGRGYLLEEEKSFESVNLSGISLTWTVPAGQRYYRYMTSLAVKGGRIFIVETAGDQETFEKYRDEISQVLSSIIAR